MYLMNKNWTTKQKDMELARSIIEKHAVLNEHDALGLFELVVNEKEKRINFQLSSWVVLLAKQFQQLYGAEYGDQVTRWVISNCFIGSQTVH